MTRRVIALVDCNNFYVSCERLFRPALENRPVVVLSNNDGCVVSRSQEARALGVGMAAPWYQMRELAQRHGILALSSNYSLYADLSNRVMSLLAQFSPVHEVYSIDEAFLDLTGLPVNHGEYGQAIRAAVRQHVGIPVCVGIAPSKTLAKLANHCAKKQAQFDGVCDFNALPENELDARFAGIGVEEVWGVGRRSAEKLRATGIHSVLDLKRASPHDLRDRFSVVLARIVHELNGIACLELDEVVPDRQQIICSRSFGTPTSRRTDLEQAVIAYTTRAAEKLRRQQSLAGAVQVHLRTNPHARHEVPYQNSILLPLPQPTDDTRLLCHAALRGLRDIYRAGHAYQKTGVMLTVIIPAQAAAGGSAVQPLQHSLFERPEAREKSRALMRTLDHINRRMGSGTLRLLGEGCDPAWGMRRGNVSKHYTTDWNELAVCSA